MTTRLGPALLSIAFVAGTTGCVPCSWTIVSQTSCDGEVLVTTTHDDCDSPERTVRQEPCAAACVEISSTRAICATSHERSPECPDGVAGDHCDGEVLVHCDSGYIAWNTPCAGACVPISTGGAFCALTREPSPSCGTQAQDERKCTESTTVTRCLEGYPREVAQTCSYGQVCVNPPGVDDAQCASAELSPDCAPSDLPSSDPITRCVGHDEVTCWAGYALGRYTCRPDADTCVDHTIAPSVPAGRTLCALDGTADPRCDSSVEHSEHDADGCHTNCVYGLPVRRYCPTSG